MNYDGPAFGTWKKKINMDYKTNNDAFMVQGGDTPVPVGEEGGQAGPLRPSSNDRGPSPVEDQAGAVSATGASEAKDPFRRSACTPRSPPSNAPKELGTIAIGDEEEQTRPAKKRKAKGSPPTPATAKVEPSALLLNVKAKINELESFGKKNQNVHREVKRMVSELNSLIHSCIMENRHEKSVRISLEKENKELRKEIQVKRSTANVACQTSFYTPDYKDGEEERIEISTLEVDTFEEVRPVLDKAWTRTSYASTKIIKGDPLKGDFGSLLFFADPSFERSGKDERRILDRYPELSHSAETICPCGSYIGVEQIVRYKEAGEGLINRVRHIMCVKLDPSEDEENVLGGIYGMLKVVKGVAEEAGWQEMVVIAPQGVSGGRFRKLCEIAFRNSGIVVNINNVREPGRGKSTNKKRKKAIIIEGDAGSYADTLRTLKSSITDQDSINAIGRIRKTARGNMLLTLEGEGGQVFKKIEEALKGRKIRSIGDRKERTITIRDIDSFQTEDDVKKGIMEAINMHEQEKIIIRAMRPTMDGNQLASIEMGDEDTRRLLQKGRLRIGLSLCRVQERVQVLKCYRCSNYGHKATECRGTDRSGWCLKCGVEGHSRRECVGQAFCPLCERNHEAGSAQCAAFRKALELERNSRNNYVY